MNRHGYAREVDVKQARRDLRKQGRIDIRGICSVRSCGGSGAVWRDGLPRKMINVGENKKAQVRITRCPDTPGLAPGVDWDRFSERAGRWSVCPQCRGHHVLGGSELDCDCGPSDDRVLWLTGRAKRPRKRRVRGCSSTTSPTTEQAAALLLEPSELEDECPPNLRNR